MPRFVRRIPLAEHDAASALAPAVEWELTAWRGLDVPGLGLTTAREFDDAWRQYRELLLPAWMEAMPGSRPFAMYVVGEIDPPPIVDELRGYGAGRRIGDREWRPGLCYGARDAGELEHLVRLGIVRRAEAAAGRRRIAEHGCRELYRWQAAEDS